MLNFVMGVVFTVIVIAFYALFVAASDADDAMESPCESCGGCKHLDESTDEYAPRPTDRPDPKRMGGQA